MVEPIMLITTHELQHGKDHSPYLLGNVDFFELNMINILYFCLLLETNSSSSKLYSVSYIKKF